MSAGPALDPARGDTGEAWAATLERYIAEHWNHPISLATIAEVFELSPCHLARRFRRIRGRTLGETIRRFRVAVVCQQLAEGDQSIAELAVSAGFYDQSHLGRWFKRHTDCTPAAFRARCRAFPYRPTSRSAPPADRVKSSFQTA